MNFKKVIIPLLMVIFAAIANSAQDTVAHHYSQSVFAEFEEPTFYNANQSWKAKWKNGDHQQGERFWGSSTIFVKFTDFWHLMKSVSWMLLFGAMSILAGNGWKQKMGYFLFFYITFTAVFELFYSQIWV
ncbi:MAG: hypothetical protein ACI9XO_000315 [Paraglaciecola sp.]|jgi:hypothetical protein